ncbi:MAG: class B sortase [Lachnospiraceae bacterium]|nr:class B sortase [Lachnospiraceae bacterium]
MSIFSRTADRIASRRRAKREAEKARLAKREEKRAAVLDESEEKSRLQSVSRKGTNGIMNVILLVSSAVLVVCLLELGWYYYKGYEYERSQAEIEKMMDGGIAVGTDIASLEDPVEEPEVRFPDEEGYKISTVTKKYRQTVSDRWKEQYRYLVTANPDCFGYLEVPDTKLKLPVMYTPNEYDYYLYRNFSGSYETRGTPFMDSATRLGESQNYIIYAHNMYDGSAFGSLPEYLKKDYYEQHKYIYFNTAISEGIYEVIAVCRTAIYEPEENRFRYHIYGGPLSQKDFEYYVKSVKRLSNYTIDTTAEWGDELITLSTCYHMRTDDYGRLIVVAKRIK